MGIVSRYRHKFKYAFQGLYAAIKNEASMRFHLAAAVAAVGGGLYFRLPSWKWAALLITIGIVLICEMFNTAIETVVDLYKDSYDPLAQRAKDIAAGAVLVAAVMAVFVGLVIFYW